MTQPQANRSETSDRLLEGYRDDSSPKHFLRRLGETLVGINPEIWTSATEISLGGRKEFPDDWEQLADLAVEHFEHPLLVELRPLDGMRNEELKVNAKRTAYFYILKGGQYGEGDKRV